MTTAAVLTPLNLTLVRFFVAAATLLTFATSMPAPAQAATLTDTQVKEVVDLLSSYDADREVIKKVEEVLHKSQKVEDDEDRPDASSCAFLIRSLKRGHQGEDVKKLQEYLKESGDFSDDATGYFGPKTEEALKRLQARHNVVSSGDADTTGYGALGPKTRSVLMERCKEGLSSFPPKNDAATSTKNTAAPTCTLVASESEVESGEKVTLTWASTNATYASTQSGAKGPTEGSVEVELEETTVFVKKIYGPGGVGQCTATVEVTGSSESKREMVWNTDATLLTANTIMAVGDGIANAVTAYFEFFGVRF